MPKFPASCNTRVTLLARFHFSGLVMLLWIAELRSPPMSCCITICWSGLRELLDQFAELRAEGGHQGHHHHDHQQHHYQQREQQRWPAPPTQLGSAQRAPRCKVPWHRTTEPNRSIRTERRSQSRTTAASSAANPTQRPKVVWPSALAESKIVAGGVALSKAHETLEVSLALPGVGGL